MIQLEAKDFLDYCREQRGLSENTLRAYQQDIEAYHVFVSCHPMLDHVTSSTILVYQKYLRESKGNSASTIRRRVTVLRIYFDWLNEVDNDRKSPFWGLRLDLKLPQKLPRPVDRPLLESVLCPPKLVISDGGRVQHSLTASTCSKNHVTRLVIRILIATGLRIGELTHLRKDDLFASGGHIRVRGKGNRERTVYITNKNLLTDFQAYLRNRWQIDCDTDFVFVNTNGRRLTEAAFRKRLRELSDELEIKPHLTPHRMRHSAATLLIEEGVDIRIVQRLLGHASISTTELYTKVSDTSLFNAIKQADTVAKLEQKF